MNLLKRAASLFIAFTFILGIMMPSTVAHAETMGNNNLVFNNGTMDGILADGESERILNGDWGQSYPVATFGGENADSPAKIVNIDGNNVIVLEKSTGDFSSFFADLYAEGTTLPGGYYELSMDLYADGSDFSTDNVGFTLYNQFKDVRIYADGWHDCEEKSNGWLHYSKVFKVDDNLVDSIQMWFNTTGKTAEECALYVDNISFRPLNEQESKEQMGDIPEEIVCSFNKGSAEDLAIELPATGAIDSLAEESGYVLENGSDYTVDGNSLIIPNDYLRGLNAGENRWILIIEGKEFSILINIATAKPDIPTNKEDFVMQETLIGGDFEIFEENTKFSLEQAEGSWGSNVDFDDPGVIKTKDGSRALCLQKGEKPAYSSAFVFVSPTIQENDVLTLRFDYKLEAKNPKDYLDSDINFCFVSASNSQMCKIPLDNSKQIETSGDGDYQWEIKYLDKENGWVSVELTFVANTALMTYNSMRFLMPTDKADPDDALWIDNVSLCRWIKPEKPAVVTSEKLVFDLAAPESKFVLLNLNGIAPQSLTVNSQEVPENGWSINASNDTITFSADYLATLDKGVHTFTVTTIGGSCDFDIEVVGETAMTDKDGVSAGTVCVIVICILAVAIGIVIVAKRKKK